MTEQDPPRMRELVERDSELSELLDAAGRDVAPREVLTRSAERLSAAVGFSVGELTGLGAPPIDAAASALASKSTAAASVASTAAKSAATAATAAAATGKSAAVLAPLLSAATKPLLVVALASATTVAVWKAQPEPAAAPASAPAAVPAPPIAKPAEPTRVHPNIDPYVVPSAPIAPPAKSAAIEAPPVQRATAPRAEHRLEAREHLEPRAIESTPARLDPTSDSAEELRSLQAAQALLASSPSGAVQRLRAHAAKWPRGWLDEERAALLVEALLRAGDRTQAERALDELRTRSPRSPALPRLGRMLAQDNQP